MSTYIDQIIIYLEVTLKETHYYLYHIRSTHSSYLNFRQFDYQFQYLTPSITLFFFLTCPHERGERLKLVTSTLLGVIPVD
jgi:hypothetical protein